MEKEYIMIAWVYKKSDRGIKVEKKTSILFKAVWGVIFILGIYIIFCGARDFARDSNKTSNLNVGNSLYNVCMSYAGEIMFPSASYMSGTLDCEANGLLDFAQMYGLLHPFSYNISTENEAVEAMQAEVISSDGVNIENAKKIVSDSFESLAETENDEDIETVSEMENIEEAHDDTYNSAAEFDATGIEYDVGTLTYDFLLNNFYTVDGTTSISSDRLNASKLLSKDMTIKNDATAPQILIYHTHSQEGFVDSKSSDSSTTIVGVGEYLAQLLRDNYGYNVIHDTTSYDVIDGKIDRNKAYSLASSNISKILKENPSIEVVIDLHRDGIEGGKVVTDINGKPTAKIMFFNGLSYTNKNGEISHLQNPYIEDNLSFSLKLQIEAAKYYPGFTRKIYLKGYRYNLHLRPKALLIEAGAQNNTLEEELNAMEPLADVLNRVLKGDS